MVQILVQVHLSIQKQNKMSMRLMLTGSTVHTLVIHVNDMHIVKLVLNFSKAAYGLLRGVQGAGDPLK